MRLWVRSDMTSLKELSVEINHECRHLSSTVIKVDIVLKILV